MPLTPDTDWQEGGKSAFFRSPKGKEGTDWEFKIRNDLKALHFHTIGHMCPGCEFICPTLSIRLSFHFTYINIQYITSTTNPTLNRLIYFKSHLISK